jgi:hypothetical protein
VTRAGRSVSNYALHEFRSGCGGCLVDILLDARTTSFGVIDPISRLRSIAPLVQLTVVRALHSMATDHNHICRRSAESRERRERGTQLPGVSTGTPVGATFLP